MRDCFRYVILLAWLLVKESVQAYPVKSRHLTARLTNRSPSTDLHIQPNNDGGQEDFWQELLREDLPMGHLPFPIPNETPSSSKITTSSPVDTASSCTELDHGLQESTCKDRSEENLTSPFEDHPISATGNSHRSSITSSSISSPRQSYARNATKGKTTQSESDGDVDDISDFFDSDDHDDDEVEKGIRRRIHRSDSRYKRFFDNLSWRYDEEAEFQYRLASNLFKQRKAVETKKDHFRYKLTSAERLLLGTEGRKLYRALMIRYGYLKKDKPRCRKGTRARPTRLLPEQRNPSYKPRSEMAKRCRTLVGKLLDIQSGKRTGTFFDKDDLEEVKQLASIQEPTVPIMKPLALFLQQIRTIEEAWQEDVLVRYGEEDKRPFIDKDTVDQVRDWLSMYRRETVGRPWMHKMLQAYLPSEEEEQEEGSEGGQERRGHVKNRQKQ